MQQSDVSGIELIARVAGAIVEQVETVMPGKVVSYDASEEIPRATVQLSIKGHRFSETDNDIIETYEMGLVNGPVVHFGGAGNAVYTPLVAGDDVLVLTASRDIDNAVGGATLPAEPATTRRHHVMDAFILPAPWLGVGSALRTSSTAGAMVLSGVIQLGAGAAAQSLTTTPKVLDRLNAIELAHNSGVNPTTGVPVTPLTLTVTGDLEADPSIKVKV
jgi:hypothetical protein